MTPGKPDEMEAEAVAVLRLVVRQTERGENLDADLFERAKAIVERYDRAMMKGHEASNVVPLKRD
jgi:molybdenum-dependent DNA-binding transcriptional regulator ModE